jgi:hypothetical protein
MRAGDGSQRQSWTSGYSARVATFLQADPIAVLGALTLDQARSFRTSEAQQLRAWDITCATLRAALRQLPEAAAWRLILEFPMRRLGRRIDALLITPRGPFVIEVKAHATAHSLADRRQVEDYALDLQDFHAASRHHPIIPILLATAAEPAPPAFPLLLAGVAGSVLLASGESLAGLLRALWRRLPEPATALDVDGWEHAPYHPVAGIIDAACTLFSHHGVADIAAARADRGGLTATTEAVLQAIAGARSAGRHLVVFVSGIPGAGKTLCGLNTVFGTGRGTNATFLTGNPTLVHVLREALARDAARGDRARLRAARQRTKAAIQALPAFRDHHIGTGHTPAEHVAVIDEAQRAWSRDHAIRKSAGRAVPLHDSEPGHLLAIMARHDDWAVIVCLIGHGQEIHDGEGGLAEWGRALQAQPRWHALAATAAPAADPRQNLPPLPRLQTLAALHLDVPMRSLRNDVAAAWVDAVLADDVATAAHLAATRAPLPFHLTRDLAALRGRLRHAARGHRRAGLVASSGAARLRAEGLGSEVAHMDAAAVAHWFLDRWPDDVRASDALEQVATEFSCQGLELDHVGLCWGGDLVRGPRWLARNFVGTRWQMRRSAEAVANRLNTYRVLLTRARYDTVIWVPRGDPADATRLPDEMDRIAAHLLRCGVPPLTAADAPVAPVSARQPSLI